MSKVLTSLPVGERVGIAFSGGLDTSVAVAWMRDKGADPVHLHRRHRPVRRARHRRRPRPRDGSTAPRSPAPSTARRRSSRRGSPRWRAAPSTSARAAAPTSTPRRSAAPSPARMLVRAMHEDGVDIWGDGSTFKGNDIERFYRYGLLANPELRIYKPWLDADFVARARRPRRDEPVAHRARPALPRQQGEGVLHRRQHLGRHPRGQDARAPRRVAGDRRADHGREVLGPDGRHRRPRTSPSASRPGRPVAINGTPFDDPVALVHEANTIGGRHGLGMSDQIENRIIEAKSPRHLRGARHGAAVDRLRAAAQRDPQRGHHRELPRPGPPARPAALRGPVARPAGADAARVDPALDRLAGHRRGDAAAAARRGLHDPAHRGRELLLPPGQALDGAHRERRLRPDRPDRPADHAQPRHRRLPRQARAVRRPAARPGPGARRERHALRRARGRRRRPDRPRNPAAEGDESDRASTTPPWSSAPTDR